MTSDRPALSAVSFGYQGAEHEAVHKPDLLLGGFLDPGSWVSRVENGQAFLVLGMKGAGKSALIEHIYLKRRDDPTTFVEKCILEELSLMDFANLKTGESPGMVRMITAWKFLLLLKVFESLDNDESARLAIGPDFEHFKNELQRAGLFRSAPNKVAWNLSRATVKLNLGALGGGLDFERASLHLVQVVELMENLLARTPLATSHLIAVDGLDNTLVREEREWEALAALVDAAGILTRRFREQNTPIHIVVLCRSDLYDRLPSPNSNKHKADSAVTIQWYPSSGSAETSPLFELANRKAAAQFDNLGDIVETYLPRMIRVGRGSSSSAYPARRYLMDFTRHTPRDFLTLLNTLGKQNPGETRLTNTQVRSGAAAYSVDYFVGEIANNLSGFLGQEQKNQLLDILGSMGHQQFRYNQVSDSLQRLYGWDDRTVRAALMHAYRIGAIGERFTSGQTVYTNYSYRNPNASTRLDGRLILQTALSRGLNRPWAPPEGVPVGDERKETSVAPPPKKRRRRRNRRGNSGSPSTGTPS